MTISFLDRSLINRFIFIFLSPWGDVCFQSYCYDPRKRALAELISVYFFILPMIILFHPYAYSVLRRLYVPYCKEIRRMRSSRFAKKPDKMRYPIVSKKNTNPIRAISSQNLEKSFHKLCAVVCLVFRQVRFICFQSIRNLY